MFKWLKERFLGQSAPKTPTVPPAFDVTVEAWVDRRTEEVIRHTVRHASRSPSEPVSPPSDHPLLAKRGGKILIPSPWQSPSNVELDLRAFAWRFTGSGYGGTLRISNWELIIGITLSGSGYSLTFVPPDKASLDAGLTNLLCSWGGGWEKRGDAGREQFINRTKAETISTGLNGRGQEVISLDAAF